MTFRRRLLVAVLIVTVLVPVGCGPTKVKTTISPALAQYAVRSIAIVPFDRLTTPQIVDSGDPMFSVPGGVRTSGSKIDMTVAPAPPERVDRQTIGVPPFAAEKITEMIYRKLRRREGVRLISPADTAHTVRSVITEPTTPPERVAKEVARKLGVDAALIGRVSVYRERDGSRWGANPATVGFELKLIGPDGMTLWTGNYYERQGAITEDFVGFWQHGGGYVTAEKLAEYGADRLVSRFPLGAS